MKLSTILKSNIGINKKTIMRKDIPAWSVHVETRNGHVYLSGTVMSETERQHIVAIVESVKGVSKVVDEMSVAPKTTD
jgi:hyperosmotically inducible periplasmic protein